ncbi:GPI mannosyltransferase 2-like isoform X2 [Hordeum vulgare subsp. vulgare]|uniref:GPI mannosyltransferase 2-like isoform X2 n=1 Tax=Hordeum vulgare subsp. vulgare TaxID=112509 RepID=UPI001D1A50B7|nr:GPI mannosyltransferase 2-like isoform X2 [Hordeum vulgare subsp. vulgare]
MATPLVTIVRLAAASRVLVLTLSLLACLLFRPYDTSASLHPPCLSSPSFPPSTSSSNSTTATISSLAVWDGVHFARAAECGYEYEQSFAFLPLLPASITLLSRSRKSPHLYLNFSSLRCLLDLVWCWVLAPFPSAVFAPLVPMLGYRAVLVISGHVLNNVAFVAAAAYFYRLSVLILKDSGAAYRASVLFCFNPASVFYSSLYSESLYALFSLGGLFYLFFGSRTVAMIMLALSGSARSNGALNAGYICFEALLQAYDAAIQKKRHMALVTGFLRSTFIFLPFFAFQAYGYLNICLHGYTDELRPWCKAKLPLLYSFIQSHYWGVGFLRYFQVKQLPNFLLASPVLSLAVYSIVHYIKLLHQLFQSTSIHEQIIANIEGRLVEAYESSEFATVLKSEISTGLNSKKQGNTEVKKRKSVTTRAASASLDGNVSTRGIVGDNKDGCPLLVLPFILHLTFMTFTAFFVMHVQVSTRFLSASPPIYWAASHILAPARGGSCKRWGYFIVVYFIAYILLGSLLFPNFYPFT